MSTDEDEITVLEETASEHRLAQAALALKSIEVPPVVTFKYRGKP